MEVDMAEARPLWCLDGLTALYCIDPDNNKNFLLHMFTYLSDYYFISIILLCNNVGDIVTLAMWPICH